MASKKKVPKLKAGKDLLAHKKSNALAVGVEAWNPHSNKKVFLVFKNYGLKGACEEYLHKKAALKVYKDLRKR